MTQTQINTVGGVPLNIGLYPATHPVAQYLGARPIGPEKSKNYSIGITLTPSNGFTMTVDAYRLKISDKIYDTTLIDVTPKIEAALIAAGIEGAGSIVTLTYCSDERRAGRGGVRTCRFGWGGDD